MTREAGKHAGVVRRWFPVVVVLLVAGFATTIQLTNDTNQQDANTLSMAGAVVGAALIGLWWLFFSRLAWRLRLLGLAGAAAAVGLFTACFEIRGVTGNLLPVFAWRFGETTSGAATAGDIPRAPARRPLPGLADFPQFFGPRRQGKLDGPQLRRDWEAHPPEELWRKPVGAGWSGFSVAGRRAVTQEQLEGDEAVVCYDVANGDVLWVRRDAARFTHPLGGVGPRATPTIDEERVFTLGATGILNCLELATGKAVWTRDIRADNAAGLPEYGFAGSPLVVGSRVIVSAGGTAGRSLVAYDKATGDRVWSAGRQPAHWSSPVRATLAGHDQILMLNALELTAHDVRTGTVLWSYPWRPGHPHVAVPVAVGGDRVLVSSGYGTGCHLVKITGDGDGRLAAERIWRSLAMKAKFANFLVHDGHIYGLDDGILACVDLGSGRRRWKGGRYGHGQLLLVGELLLVMGEAGDVILVEAMPDEHREVTRMTVFGAKTWNSPALAGRYLLVRNDREAACLRLPVADE